MLKASTGRYRWWICTLIFFATTVNYLDRAVISLLKGELEALFSWTESDYANIVIAFQLFYALGLLFAGRWVDSVGTKAGYAVSIFLWSLSAIGHAFASSAGGFIVARAALGISESGNFPAAIKSVAEWFPPKERALATGLFNSGANIGAILAPLSVPFIAETWGWKWAFILTGLSGLLVLLLWMRYYDVPDKQPRVNAEEKQYIREHTEAVEETDDAGSAPTPWLALAARKSTWAFVIGKFLTDPVWWFYLFWLPSFLKSTYGISGTAAAMPVALVYIIATAGSVAGGWLPYKLINGGMKVTRARSLSMLIYAIVPLSVISAQYLGKVNMWLSVLVIGAAAAAHAAWSANIFTTVSDRFPKKDVGAVVGMGGMAGALGGILIARTAGMMFDHYKAIGNLEQGYAIMFLICGSAYLVAWGVMTLLTGNMSKGSSPSP